MTGVSVARSPTTRLLHRARLIFVLTALLPTVLMTAIGIILLATGGSKSMSLVGGILVLAFCATALDRLHARHDLRDPRRRAGRRAERVPVVGLARAAHAADVDPDVHRHAARGPRRGSRRAAALPDRDQPGARRASTAWSASSSSCRRSSRATPPSSGARSRSPTSSSDALAAFEAVRFGSEVDLRVTVEPGLRCRGDRGALAQALGNLLSNAWKYTRPSDKRIAVDASGRHRPRGHRGHRQRRRHPAPPSRRRSSRSSSAAGRGARAAARARASAWRSCAPS